MRSPYLKRVHISTDNRELELWKKFAGEKYHGSLSQAIRAAMEYLIDRSKDGGGAELRPIVERLDGIERSLGELQGTLENIGGLVEAMWSSGGASQVLLDALIKILQGARRPLSIEAIREKLPKYDAQEVRRGLEELTQKFVVETVMVNGNALWKLVGVGYDANE